MTIDDKLVPEGEYDPCVSCGAKTEYQKQTPIQERARYIETMGQLCPKCYRGTYKETE